MQLVPYDVEKIRYYKPSKNQKILEEFIESGLDCVKLKDWNHKNARSLQSTLYSSKRRFHINNVAIVIRKGGVFLVRTD